MKKVYVKTKTPSAKTVLKRPYIAATVIGASVCAIALSFAIKEPVNKNAEINTEISEPSGILNATPTTTEPPMQEIVIPSTDEVINPDRQEIPSAVANKDTDTIVSEESVSVGLFGNRNDIKLMMPVDGEIMKEFSGNKPVKSKTLGDWRIHSGIDIKADKRTEVKASADGKIVYAGRDGLTGHTISIDHGNGIISTVYNLETSESVSEGQTVKSGDVIGLVGASAPIEIADDSHIHFEVKIDNEYVNPKDYIK